MPMCHIYDWQYITGRVAANNNYTGITFEVVYANQANYAWFDGMQLYKEEYGNSYQYDSNGNVISVINSASQTSQSEYAYYSNNYYYPLLSRVTSPKKGKTNYDYDVKGNLTKVMTPENLTNINDYNTNGNTSSSQIGDSNSYIKANYTYSANDNYLTGITDPSGNITSFNYDTTKGTLTNFTDPKNKVTSYTYNPSTDQLLTVSKSVEGQAISNNYTYSNDKLAGITHNNTNYTFNYNKLGNNTQTLVGSQSMAVNTYENRTQKLTNISYGNGQQIGYEYDMLDRLSTLKYNGNIRYKYTYDINGNLGKSEDFTNSSSIRYIYDMANRPVCILNANGNMIEFNYDINGNRYKIFESIGSAAYSTNYAYDGNNRPVNTMFHRPIVNNDYIEYFMLNNDTKGSKGTIPINQSSLFC